MATTEPTVWEVYRSWLEATRSPQGDVRPDVAALLTLADEVRQLRVSYDIAHKQLVVGSRG